MDYTVLTDKQLIDHVRERGEMTILEAELTCRLERALDEVDACAATQVAGGDDDA